MGSVVRKMRLLLIGLLLLGCCAGYDDCLAQSESVDQTDQSAAESQERTARRERMQKFSASVEFFDVKDRDKAARLAFLLVESLSSAGSAKRRTLN